MWNLPYLVSNIFDNLDNPSLTNAPSHFCKRYICYPVTFRDRDDMEVGNKILLPQSALSILSRMNLTWPMVFLITNTQTEKSTHCGVLEFSSDENICYMPYWMMKNLLLKEGDSIEITNKSLPKGTYVKLQPVTTDFLNIYDHRSVLENNLRHFATLTVGDIITIKYNEKKYDIEIIDSKPSKAISVIETDIEVDFSPPKDYIEKEIIKSQSSSSKLDNIPNDTDNAPRKNFIKLKGGVRTVSSDYNTITSKRVHSFEPFSGLPKYM